MIGQEKRFWATTIAASRAKWLSTHLRSLRLRWTTDTADLFYASEAAPGYGSLLATIGAEDTGRMTTQATKSKVLEDAGYVYSFDRQAYVNRTKKKIFSIEFVEDHSVERLQQSIAESNSERGWQMYFNTEPSPSVRRELENVLG